VTEKATGKPRLLLLMPTTTYRAEPFFEAARALGAEVVVGSDRCHVLAAEWGIPLALDFRNPQGAADEIVAHAMATPFNAIIPVDDKTTLIAALASRALGLVHNPAAAAAAARNKRIMREVLAAAGVPVPRFATFPIDLPAGEAAAAVAAAVGYPCVLKPLLLSGSRGVMRADIPEAFAVARERLEAILRAPEAAAPGGTEAREFLVEEFVPGPEFALEGLVSGGRLQVLALFDKPDPLDGPIFEETIYVTPSRLPAAGQETLAAAAARAVEALGLREGPVHAELRLNARGAWVIEVAARSIGGLCSRTLRFGLGVTLEELILRHALGLPIPSAEREARAAGVMMIPIPRGGVLEEVEGVGEACRVAGVESIDITAALGHFLVPLPEGSSYLGFIVARGNDPARVEASLREAHRHLRFRIAPAIPLEKTLY
jgi:biotin carboxylase